ncbi:MAG: efflux RND transporter periplasmic adaptor subunit [Ignavibacteriales bacterium]|nr:MAG: efflux RND transporter periplasmic adaptor subunit [Ignavibacteriales bacterium]
METKSADLSALKINRTEENNNPRRDYSYYYKKIAVVLIIIVVLAAGYFIVQSLLDTSVEVNLTSVVLRSPSESNAILTASGYVVAQRKASVASKGTGRLIYLGVVEGDKVKKNEIIARLDDSDIKAQLDQAKANLKLSEAELKDAERSYYRQKELLKSNATSQEAVDVAEARYLRVLANIELMKAGVVGAEVAMENMLIRAPFDGTVLTKNADVGEIVAPLAASASSKAAVVTMADMKSLQVETDVSESNIERIIMNQTCEIILDAYPDRRYPGYVAKIVPTADRSKATVMVKVGFKDYDSRVLPEMSAKVMFMMETGKKVDVQEKAVLVVPTSSLIKKDNKIIVYTVKDGKIEETIINTGRQFDIYTEVTSGLTEGDRVVETINEKIKDGVKVKVE